MPLKFNPLTATLIDLPSDPDLGSVKTNVLYVQAGPAKGQPQFIGYAVAGTKDSDFGWRVVGCFYDGAGVLIELAFPQKNGIEDSSFSFRWQDIVDYLAVVDTRLQMNFDVDGQDQSTFKAGITGNPGVASNWVKFGAKSLNSQGAGAIYSGLVIPNHTKTLKMEVEFWSQHQLSFTHQARYFSWGNVSIVFSTDVNVLTPKIRYAGQPDIFGSGYAVADFVSVHWRFVQDGQGNFALFTDGGLNMAVQAIPGGSFDVADSSALVAESGGANYSIDDFRFRAGSILPIDPAVFTPPTTPHLIPTVGFTFGTD